MPSMVEGYSGHQILGYVSGCAFQKRQKGITPVKLAADQQWLPGLLHLSQVYANKQRMRIGSKSEARPMTSATTSRDLGTSPRRIRLVADIALADLRCGEIGTRGDAPDRW
jgi:hypothetical protein